MTHRPLLAIRHLRWSALLTIGLALSYTVAELALLPVWSLPPLTAAWLALAWRLRWGAPALPATAIQRRWPWSLLPLVLWGVYVYLHASFGAVDLGAVFFHLQAGIRGHGGVERSIAALGYTLAVLAVLASVTWLVRHDRRWQRHERWLAIALLVANPLLYGVSQRGAAIVTDDGAWLDRRYVEPVVLEAPASPPNLLVLYLESLERTYADRQRFGDAYADLDALGERGLVFEGVRQLDNTGWTMAGMIASQCGVPLMPAGLLHDSQLEPLQRVVPGIPCLGDLLSAQGYRLSYLGGASLDFAGKGVFYADHGFARIQGRTALEPRLADPDYVNDWGLYDDSLYDIVLEEIQRLDAANDGPWGVVALSLAGHAPHGYPARRCRARQGDFDGTDILYSVQCSAWLARDLIERLDARGLLDNTLVVVASDHLTMRVSAWEQLIQSPRENTFLLLGPNLPAERRRRDASMVDVLPTVLEAMGFTIDWHRAGLGVSLLSDTPTLVEQYGLEALNARLRAETALQERLWEGLAPSGEAAPPPPATPAGQVLEAPQDAVRPPWE